MERRPPGNDTTRSKLAVLAIVWSTLLAGCFFSVKIANPPGMRWDLWVFVPDLVDSPQRGADAGRSGWQYFPQRFDLLAVAGCILAGAWGAGHLVLRILRPPLPARSVEHTVFAFGIGLAALSLMTLGAGLAGVLSRPLLVSVIATAVAMEAAFQFSIFNFQFPFFNRHHQDQTATPPLPPLTKGGSPHVARWMLFSVPFVPFVLAMLLGSLLPSTDFDVNEYHFEGPKEFFQAGRISFREHNVYTSFPFGTEMLTLLAMVLRDDWYRGALAGKCVLMCFGPLTALALFAAGRCWFGTTAGLCAAFLYLATPWVYRISTIAYAEGGVSFYLFATLLALIIAIDRGSREAIQNSPARQYLLVGLMAGSAMSCKYPALVSVVVPLGAAVCFLSWMSRDGIAPRWTFPLAFACGVALTIGPWLVKNTIETGNPVYPLAYGMFGGRDWDSVLDVRWRKGHSPPSYAVSSLVGLACDVTYRSDWISPLLFGLAPAGLFAASSRRRAVGLAAYVGWLFASCWLVTHRIDRFWVPMLPVVALLAGAGLAWWWSAFTAKWARGTLVLLVCAMAAFHLEFMTGVGNWCGYNDYLRDLDEAGHVAASVSAPEILYLNEHLPIGAKVLSVGDAEMFVSRFPVVYNTVFDRSIFEEWFAVKSGGTTGSEGLRDAAEIRETLAAAGITHIYVNWLEVLRYRSPGNYGYTDFVTPERFAELQHLGILGPAWSIPDASMDLDRVDALWQPELESWGKSLITRRLEGASFVTFQVFPVTNSPSPTLRKGGPGGGEVKIFIDVVWYCLRQRMRCGGVRA